LIGELVRRVANLYGQKLHNAYLLTVEEANQIIEILAIARSSPCLAARTGRISKRSSVTLYLALMVRINEEDRWALKKNRDVHIYVIIFIYNVHHLVMNISIRN